MIAPVVHGMLHFDCNKNRSVREVLEAPHGACRDCQPSPITLRFGFNTWGELYAVIRGAAYSIF